MASKYQFPEVPLELLFMGNAFVVTKNQRTIVYASADPVEFVDYCLNNLDQEFDFKDNEDSSVSISIWNKKEVLWKFDMEYDQVIDEEGRRLNEEQLLNYKKEHKIQWEQQKLDGDFIQIEYMAEVRRG